MHRNDVRVVQAGCGLRLLQEAAPAHIILRIALGQNLDRDHAVKPAVPRPKNLTHAAAAKTVQDLVLRNCRARHIGRLLCSAAVTGT